MAQLPQFFAVLPVHHRLLEVACAHSETMGMEEDVAGEVVPVEVIVDLLLFLWATGNEGKGYQMEVLEVEVVGIGRRIK
jgi:hypothetical protein